jgi:superfamily II helicase
MITSIVAIILLILLFTDMGGLLESLVTVGFLAFFFIYLLRLLNVIDKPFKAGHERTDDDVSLFLLTEFMVHARTQGSEALPPEDLAAKAEQLEEQMAEVEEAHAEGEAADVAEALEKVAQPVETQGVRRGTP